MHMCRASESGTSDRNASSLSPQLASDASSDSGAPGLELDWIGLGSWGVLTSPMDVLEVELAIGPGSRAGPTRRSLRVFLRVYNFSI